MSASSINRKVAEIEKAKKVERRNAAIERYESENSVVKHQKAAIGGVSSEASSSDSPVVSRKVEKPKAESKKSGKGWRNKKVFADS